MSVLPIEVASVFDFQNFINFGSYGSVLKVMKKSMINLGNQKSYAMKIVVTEPGDNNSLKNAEAELKVLLEINSPYIINLDSYFKVEDKVYMALEYCPNRDLLKAMADKKSENQDFDEDEIWKYFIQTSFGLEALHTNEFIHRDIKPQNILLDENMDVKLADFGLSRHLQASSVAGTLPFYSPRMCNGDFPTKESDVWALGCVLYCLCNFEDPFKGNKHKIQNEEHMPIKSQYSQELRYLVDWCLKKKRNERPTIKEIITHEFIVNKTVTLGITIPTASAMSTIYRSLLNSEREKVLKLESKLSEYSNEIVNQKTENEHLKEEIVILKKTIAEKDKDIETLSVKTIERINPLEESITNFIEKQLEEKSLIIAAKNKDIETASIKTIETANPLEESKTNFFEKQPEEKSLIIAAKDKDVSVKTIEPVNPLELSKTNFIEKQPEEKSLIEAKKVDAEKTKKIIGDSGQDLNPKVYKPGIVWSRESINILAIPNLSSKESEILKNPNSSELEEELKKTCSVYENVSSTHDTSVEQAKKDDTSTYHQKACLFNIDTKYDRTNLYIYDTETETKDTKILQTIKLLTYESCIAQLPNGKLFCLGYMALLIDENYSFELIPSGTPQIYMSSAIYFNNNIYCFGGIDVSDDKSLFNCTDFSSKFDLGRNKWKKLKKLPKADYCCNSVIFLGDILISGKNNKNLWRYCIDRNSFTTIPYDFAERKRKILINSGRLYLIECEYGLIYESEIGSDTAWRQITDSTIGFDPCQTYCQYNKGDIYIGCLRSGGGFQYCFKFNLNKKRLNKLT